MTETVMIELMIELIHSLRDILLKTIECVFTNE